MAVISYKDIFAPSFWQAWNDFLNQRYTDMWFTGGRGCIAADTLIATPSGDIPVQDFKGGLVYSYDGESLVTAYALPAEKFQEEDLYLVDLDDGSSITVTDQHRFLSPSDGWVMTKELKPGSLIAVARAKDSLPSPDSTPPSLSIPPQFRFPIIDKTLFSRQDDSEAALDTLSSWTDAFTVPASSRALRLSTVASVRFSHRAPYYDLFVPVYNNYLTANGILNHNSTKSSFVTMCIVLGMIRDSQEAFAHKAAGNKRWVSYLTHAIVYRKVAADLRISVYNQFVWSIEKLGLSDKFKFSVSPLRITYKATGQMIDFRGLDDPIKSKSIKAPFGYYKYNFFEELNQFDGIEEIRNVRQSIMRGGHCFQSFAAFNPSPCSSDFCNVEARKIVPGRHVYHSDYRSVPREWLGDTFFEQAEILRRDNERAYRHEYLGEVTGNGGAVFPNLVIREVPDEEIALYDMKFFGVDFGFSLDPTVYLEIRMDKNHHRIFIIDEIYQTNLRNIEFAELLKKKPSIGYNYIMCDSAEPKSIADLEAYGINALPVVKVERRFGYKYLQSFNEIIIDPRRCPHAAEEFALAEYRKLASGLFVSEYPKTNDHCQDACLKGDTLVWTDKGLNPIESLVGTTGYLYGFDIATKKEKLVPYCHCRKTRENAEILCLGLSGGGIIDCTSDHRIMLASGEYREAGDIKIGDECAGIRDGLAVTNITSSGKDRYDVYDIEVPETHNLIIGPGVVVHNCRYALSEVTAGAGMF